MMQYFTVLGTETTLFCITFSNDILSVNITDFNLYFKLIKCV